MFTEEDKLFFNDPNYSMPLEKFFSDFYYSEKNGKNRTLTQAYPFSNEQLDKLFKHLRKKNPKVLTVGSSGDQLFQALFNGSKNVTVIDGNLFSKPWIEYKISAIKHLDFKTFKEHFFSPLKTNKTPFDYDIYGNIFYDLSKESQAFWGNIFLNVSDPKYIFEQIINRSDVSNEFVRSCFYQNETSFNKLKSILNKNNYSIKFIYEEFHKFPQALSEKFDIILLSNIKSYVNNEDFINIVNQLYKNNLNHLGIIQLHYNFRYFPYHLTKNAPHYCAKNPNFYELFPHKKISNINLGLNHHSFLMHKTKRTKNQETELFEEEEKEQ